MTDTYQALVAHGINDLRIDRLDLPQPQSSEAVVDVHFGGVCGSDLHYWKHGQVGESVLREPMILGHEIVGVVRTGASDGTGPGPGTPVAVHPASVCGRCHYCHKGQQNLCEHLRYMGSAARLPHTPGGFAQRLLVASQRLVTIPDGLGINLATLAEPAAIAWHATDRVTAVGGEISGARVLVTGAGPIGLLTIAVLRRAGAREVTASDVFDRPLDVATQIGATAVLTAAEADTEAPSLEADVVIESSGSPRGLDVAVRAARRGGIVVMIGQLPAGGVEAPLHLVVTRQLTLAGSSRFYPELPAVLAALADESLDVAPVISHTYPLREAEQAFSTAANASRSSKVLLDLTEGGHNG